MPEDKNFLINMLIGTQHHLRALDQSLEILRRQLESNEKPEQDPRNPICPKCGDTVSDISAMGTVHKTYQCIGRNCDFRGELE